jgi:hypothetical protein
MLYVNLSTLECLNKVEKDEFSCFGKFYLKFSSIIKYPKYLESTMLIYTNLTGTNRGYEFFSPNVSSKSIKLIFISNKGTEIKIFNSIESDIKLITATYYINSYLVDKKLRNQIFASISSRLFILNPNINEISIYLKISEFRKLKTNNCSIVKTQTILLSKIKKND